MSEASLHERIAELSDEHGGLRAAARFIGIDPGYLSRLASGDKCHPSPEVLRRLDMRAVTTYVRGWHEAEKQLPPNEPGEKP